MEASKGGKKKRKSYTIKEKIECIEEMSKPGMSQVKVVPKFGIYPSMLHSTLAKKDAILAAGGSKKTKRLSHGLIKELEDKLYTWFLKKRSQGLNIDRPLLRTPAENMAEKMGLKD